MAATPALDLLIRSKTVHSVVTYQHNPNVESFGDEAASALGVEPARVFKTLVRPARDEDLAVGVVPVDAVLDMKALAKVLGAKRAQMADAESAARSSGYVVGGISPLGQKAPARDRDRREREQLHHNLREWRSPRPRDRAVAR